VTDLEPSVWDFVFQKAELFHELGHVRYTDFDAMEEFGDRLGDMHLQRLFSRFFNCLEDGAIERQLAVDYNVGNDLEIKNANLLMSDRATKGLEQKTVHGSQNYYEVGYAEAIQAILLDWSKYDTGRTEKLLDPSEDSWRFRNEGIRRGVIESLPVLKSAVEKTYSQPNGRERVKQAFEHFKQLLDKFEMFEDVTEDDIFTELMNLFPGDGEVYFVRPGGDPPDDAEELDVDEDDVVIFLEPGEMSDDEAEKDYGQEVEADDAGEEMEAEVKRWQSSVKATGTELSVPTESDFDESIWGKAKQMKPRFLKELRSSLTQEKESEVVTGQRAGRPDTQQLWTLKHGNARVFEQEAQPEAKDYSVVLLLDRSGSMTNNGTDLLHEAVSTVTGLALALEELGVDVAVIGVGRSFGNQEVALEKPFGVEVEEQKHILSSFANGGGTPLTPALEIASDRLRTMPGRSLVIAVTDGYPDHSDQYLEQLRKTTFPVAGVYVDEEEPDEGVVDEARSYYHRLVPSNMEDMGYNVVQMLRRLTV
jgi:nitric oxide reductase activation protein